MNDLFVRQRINEISGLTKQTQESTVSPVDLTPGTDPSNDLHWTDLHEVVDTQFHYKLSAYQITLDEGDVVDFNLPRIRILAENKGTTLDGTHKIFPFPDYTNILSGIDELLHDQVHIPHHYTFKIQIYAEFTPNTVTPTANLDYLSIVRTDPYTH